MYSSLQTGAPPPQPARASAAAKRGMISARFSTMVGLTFPLESFPGERRGTKPRPAPPTLKRGTVASCDRIASLAPGRPPRPEDLWGRGSSDHPDVRNLSAPPRTRSTQRGRIRPPLPAVSVLRRNHQARRTRRPPADACRVPASTVGRMNCGEAGRLVLSILQSPLGGAAQGWHLLPRPLGVRMGFLRPMPPMTRLRRAALQLRSPAAILAWGLLFSLVYAQSPLYTSNQNQYFLHGAARAGLGFLAQDWLARTVDSVPVFPLLVTWSYRYFHEALFYLYFALLCAVYLYSLTLIANRRVSPDPTRRLLTLTFLFGLHSAALRFVLARALG